MLNANGNVNAKTPKPETVKVTEPEPEPEPEPETAASIRGAVNLRKRRLPSPTGDVIGRRCMAHCFRDPWQVSHSGADRTSP
jgi:hypothetical protein